MNIKEFDYRLPKELIAQYPSPARGEDRLLVLDRRKRNPWHTNFGKIISYVNPGDLLVLNNTRVIPARLFGRRRTGGRVEIFILDKSKNPMEALVKPSGRVKEGENITLESGDWVRVLGRAVTGRFVEFDKPLDGILERSGHVPLPPYISRADEPSDRDRYQTVYAASDGATASPTAGLHFTKEILDSLRQKGVDTACVTLHVSYGTFAPVLEEDIEKHKMHKEYFELPWETLEKIKQTKKNKKRVVAVGTTTSRVLEHNADLISGKRSLTSGVSGSTDLYIYPGYKFRVVDALLTNFHLPKSTLLMLVSAFAGRELILKTYEEAAKKGYRFFSYGDAMLIL